MADDGRTEGSKTFLIPAAALSLVSGLVGLRAVPHHFEEWWLYGAFFLVVALGQSLYGSVLLLWPRASVLALGLLGNAASTLAYWTLRTPAAAGGVNPLDAVALVSGTLLVAALGWSLLSWARPQRQERLPVPNLSRTARPS